MSRLISKYIEFYPLDLIDMKYINLDKSYVTSSGKVYFNIDVDKVDKYSKTTSSRSMIENTLFDFTFNEQCFIASCAGYDDIKNTIKRKFLPNHNEEYYIPFVVCSKAKTCRIDTFAVKYKGVLNSPLEDYVKSTMNLLKTSQQSEYETYKEKLTIFSRQAIEWVKKQIRNTLLTDTLGDFCSDDLQRHTYSCKRKLEDKNIFYVVYEWWKYLREGSVTWTDIDNGEGAVFVALNEQ